MSDLAEEPSSKVKDVAYLIEKFGVSVVMCVFLCFILYHELAAFRKDIAWKLERSIRNERAIMKKLEIPVVLEGDQK